MKNETYEAMFFGALEKNGKLLKGYSNFHRYSFGNQLFAMWQMIGRGIEVSPIATFKKWQSLNRQVRKGEKAIELVMPVQVKDRNDEDKKKTVFIYKKGWFAMSQTDGEDVTFPEVGFDWEKALKELNIVKENFQHTNGNCQGYAKKGNIVAVNPLAELPLKTLVHEIAHVLLHLDGDVEFVDSKTDKASIKEVEAEGVALFVSLALGIEEHVEYCVGYIKNWLGGGNEIPTDSIKKIFRAADKILKAGQEKEATPSE